MSLHRLFCAVSIVTLTACTTLGGSAPPPPLTEPVLSAPSQYRAVAFKWIPGTTLTYVTTTFAEVRSGDRISRNTQRDVERFTATERTGTGLVRVLMVQNNERVGELFFEDSGHLKDLAIGPVPENQREAAEAALKGVVGSLKRWQTWAEEPVALDQSRQIEVRLAELFGSTLSGPGLPDLRMSVTMTFTGFKRLAGREVAEVRGTGAMALKGDSSAEGEVRAAFDSTSYSDAVRGFSMAVYTTMMLSVVERGSGLEIWLVSLRELDRQRSPGL